MNKDKKEKKPQEKAGPNEEKKYQVVIVADDYTESLTHYDSTLPIVELG